MRHIRSAIAMGALLGAVSACDSPLEISNSNDPDRERILLNPDDVESLGASVYQQINSATLGSIARVQTGLGTASLMNASALANNGLGPRERHARGRRRAGARHDEPHEKAHVRGQEHDRTRFASHLILTGSL